MCTHVPIQCTRFCVDSLSVRIRVIVRRRKVIFVRLINRTTAAATTHFATGEKCISIRTVVFLYKENI